MSSVLYKAHFRIVLQVVVFFPEMLEGVRQVQGEGAHQTENLQNMW